MVIVKLTSKHSPSSANWISRQLADPFVAKAHSEGYRSRAAYKLYQIHNKYKLFKPGYKVIDLGASPGGWTQVASKLVKSTRGNKTVLSVDLQPMHPIPGAHFIQADFHDLSESLPNVFPLPVDVVLSDMAPNATGSPTTDHLQIIGLVESAYRWSLKVLRPGGHFVAKIYPGSSEIALRKDLQKNFREVRYFKPEASRSDSKEIYLVSLDLKGPPETEL